MDETTSEAPVPFEDGLAALEELVAGLETGELTLEDALRSFEVGVGLVRNLNAQLSAAEQRIEILTRGVGGRVDSRMADDVEL